MTLLEELVEKALRLPTADREMLADSVLASLDREQLSTVDQAWLTEAERRFQRQARGEGQLHTAATVVDELRRLS